MVRRQPARMATTGIIPMPARPMATTDRIGLWEAFSSELGRGSAAMGTPMVFTVGDIMAAGLSGAATMAVDFTEAVDSWAAVSFAEEVGFTVAVVSTAADFTVEADFTEEDTAEIATLVGVK